MNTWSPQTMRNSIALFEASKEACLSVDGQRLEGIPCWQLHQWIKHDTTPALKDMLVTTGYAGTYQEVFNDEFVEVDLEEEDDPDFLAYYCPQTFKRQRIPIEKAAVFQIKATDFLKGVADLLDIHDAGRQGVDTALINQVLWKLGTARLEEGFHIPVFVVRALGMHLEVVISALKNERSPALVLSTSPTLPYRIQWPPGVAVGRLADAIVSHLPVTRLDHQWLYSVAIQPGDQNIGKPDDFPVSYNSVSHVLCIRGKRDWYLRGDKQRKAVQYMVKQARAERWELSAKEILAATRTPGQTGGTQRMSALFNGSSDWQDYIANPRRGVYTLKLN